MSTVLDSVTLEDQLVIGGRALRSRLMVGTGKYRTNQEMVSAIEASMAEVVTVAVRRVDLDRSKEDGVLHHLDPERYLLLPNTAGCFTAEDAIRYARLARAAGFTDWVKLEVIGDQETLLPDTAATIGAARELVADGFTVLAYTNDDLITALRLEDVGCAAVMPLASPIGSGLGLINPFNIRAIKSRLSVPVIVDAGVGTASDAAVTMEQGVDGILMNTALAEAQDPVRMARAMALATEAGRLAYLAGRMPRRERAVPSSPHPRHVVLARVEAKVTEARRVALEVLTLAHAGELADRALARAGERLEARDHAWVQELVYGTFRLRGRLDHVLARFLRSPLESLEPVVLDVLRLGAYQLLEMGSVPAYAAVSQSVELVRAAGVDRASGLVNGVLQSIRRGASEVEFPEFRSRPADHLVDWGSHPRWLIDRWLDRWGPEDTLRLVEADNRRPELYLTPAQVSAGDGVLQLRAAGIEAEEVPGFPASIRILPSTTPRQALAVLPAVVQDPAAAMVVRYADVPPGATVIDLSAAPGGKTVGLAAEGRFVVAADLSAGRHRRTRSNVDRAGVADAVAMVSADARQPPFRPVDAVLLDAPCSGTGTLRRHADGRWRITPEDLATLSRLQHELLEAASTLVGPGGLLIYATCSLEPEENEEQVEAFLRRHPEFVLVAPGTGIDGTMLTDGFLTILPQRHGVDGAFAARLYRID